MADHPPLDMDPIVRQLKSLLYGVSDDGLRLRTPCPDWTVGDLLDHMTGLTKAFTQVAHKQTGTPGTSAPPPEPSAANLIPQWRSKLPPMLDDLARAWADPNAWVGTAVAGGVTLPADQMGIVAVNELTMHGWDLAKATGQDFAVDPRTLEVLIGFLSPGPAEGTPGIFGPKVRVDDQDEAPLLDQVVALAGRDPYWRS